jgi:hypothetical protein
MHRAQDSAGDCMRIITSILSLAVLMWVEAATAQKTYSLSVSRHRAVPALSEGEVKRILADASKMLQKNSRHNHDDDIACNVTFTLKGPVRTFASLDTPEVVDKDHIDAVHRVDSNVAGVDFRVKAVKEINFCRPGVDGPFQGCSFSPPDFRSIIVVHPKSHKDPQGRILSKYPDYLLWAHEFGHLTGLGHRDDEQLALMTRCPLNTQFFNVSNARVQVNSHECRRLLAGPGVRPPDPLDGTTVCRSPQ